MTVQRTLPARMYLLAYDLKKDQQSDRAWLDYLLRVTQNPET